jgi:hypothetical protein
MTRMLDIIMAILTVVLVFSVASLDGWAIGLAAFIRRLMGH